MPELLLRIDSDRPVDYAGVAPRPLESLNLVPGVSVSQDVLLSDHEVYAFVINVAAGATGSLVVAAVMGFIRRLRDKNPTARFELEHQEIDFDDDGHIDRIISTRIKQG